MHFSLLTALNRFGLNLTGQQSIAGLVCVCVNPIKREGKREENNQTDWPNSEQIRRMDEQAGIDERRAKGGKRKRPKHLCSTNSHTHAVSFLLVYDFSLNSSMAVANSQRASNT